MDINSENAITVKDLYKSFRLPHEQTSGIKQTIINALNRKKGYELQHVLENISLEIKKGEFFGIVGRNGSGKSTLLKLLAGIYIPEKGSVDINGSLTPFIELGVGFNQELTGRENVFMNGALLGFSHKEMEEMYDKIVDFAELHRFMDQKLKNYSSGMQVRLAFSIAIRADTDILILDEVLAVGDAAFQQKCFDYFEELKLKHKTIIFVTHDMASVQRFCDRALILEKGSIKSLGKPSSIADIYIEDNIEATARLESSDKTSAQKKNFLKAIIGKHDQLKGEVSVEFQYEKNIQESTYVGFSVVKDGSTIAEINNLNSPDSNKSGRLIYKLETKNFNPGSYEIAATLFKIKNKAPIAYVSKRPHFIIKGFDQRRGGGMSLEDNWSSSI